MKRKQKTIVMGLLLGATVILVLGPQTALGQVYPIHPHVPVDLSPAEGIPPDGTPEFLVNSEVLDVLYLEPAGIELSTSLQSSSNLSKTWEVTVTNLTENLIRDAVLTVENYGLWYGPPGVHLYDTVWNPPALAGGDTPAYPLGDILPDGSNSVDVTLLLGFEIFHFGGQFNAGSIGFKSSESMPSFSDVSILLIPEPATLFLLGLGGLMVRRKRRT